MEIFNSGIFWFLEGVLFCLVLMGVRIWAEDHGIPMPPWKWLLFVAWLGLAGFVLAFVGTSLGEGESGAALRGGVLFGAITIISGVGVWRLIAAGAPAAEEPPAE